MALGGDPASTLLLSSENSKVEEPNNHNEDSNNSDTVTSSSVSHVVHPYEKSIKIIATIKTMEEFWSCYDFLVRPDNLPTTTDYHFFHEGIKPTWEDPNNARGGKWIVRLRKGLASR